MPTWLDQSVEPQKALAEPIANDACPDGNCGPVGSVPPLADDEALKPLSCREIVVGVGIVCLSLPAMIGACCWPMVVAALLNVGASVMNGGAGTGAVDFFHGFQVALMMTIMFNLVQFIYWRCKAQGRSQFPTLLMILSAIMTNFQPMGILIVGSWKLLCCSCDALTNSTMPTCTESKRSFPPWIPGSGEFRECHGDGNWFWKGTTDRCTGQLLALFPDQLIGWAIQIVLTWGGFVVMFFSVMMATQLHLKIQKRWRSARTTAQQ